MIPVPLLKNRPFAGKARDVAKKAFKGDNVKLRDEFRVSSDPSNDIDDIISDGRLLLTAVRNPANTAALKSKAGHIAKDADALATALDNLVGSETGQEKAKGTAKGATDVRNQNLNDPFDIDITIQSAAKNQFTDRQSLSAFRIGIFPPKEKSDYSGENKLGGRRFASAIKMTTEFRTNAKDSVPLRKCLSFPPRSKARMLPNVSGERPEVTACSRTRKANPISQLDDIGDRDAFIKDSARVLGADLPGGLHTVC